MKQIIDWTDKRIWAAMTDEELYNAQNAFVLLPRPGWTCEFLLGVLNSKLLSFYHRKRYLEEFKMRFQKVLIRDCKRFPIPAAAREEQACSGLAMEIGHLALEGGDRWPRRWRVERPMTSAGRGDSQLRWMQASTPSCTDFTGSRTVRLPRSKQLDLGLRRCRHRYRSSAVRRSWSARLGTTKDARKIDRKLFPVHRKATVWLPAASKV